MSRTKKTSVEGIAEATFKWNGKEGNFSYWDGESEVPVEILNFSVLDEWFKITGFSGDEKPIWSNEVKSTSEIIKMRTKDNVLVEGTYGADADKFKGMNGKYTKVLYIAVFPPDKKTAICKLELKGSSLNAWIDFTKDMNVYEHGFSFLEKSEPKKKGSNVYFEPIFDTFALTEDQSNQSDELDVILQEWVDRKNGVVADPEY